MSDNNKLSNLEKVTFVISVLAFILSIVNLILTL